MPRFSFGYLKMPLLILFCVLFYYFGELVEWARWNAMRASFYYGVHDIHRLLFLAPIIYAGYTAKVRGAIIVTLAAFIIFLPRAFFISPFPDPLLRMIVFTIFAGAIGVMVGTIRNQSERSTRLEEMLTGEREKLLKIMDGIADGIIITDRYYRIRFMDDKMTEAFGDGTGLTCYNHLARLDSPCSPGCQARAVIEKNEISKWECRYRNGKTYEVTAAPYFDQDGTACQISIFRDITPGR